MPLPHNLRSPVDMMRPEPVAVDDRSGFLVYLKDLDFQYQWTGNSLRNQRILVTDQMRDTPSEFLRTPILGPEPAPLPNARPTHYAQQNQGGVPAPTVTELNEIGD